jgi:hypothetical protein
MKKASIDTLKGILKQSQATMDIMCQGEPAILLQEVGLTYKKERAKIWKEEIYEMKRDCERRMDLEQKVRKTLAWTYGESIRINRMKAVL